MAEDRDREKQQAAEHAIDYISSGMVIGLGHGSTAHHMVRKLAERLREGKLHDVMGVPVSLGTATLAQQLGIPITTLEQHPQLDLVIDGADEVDPELNLIKGGGGALLHEKIVAASGRRLIIIADATKQVPQLGTQFPLPVEVISFGLPLCTRRLAELGCEPVLRRTADGEPFRTDEQNVILDCHFPGIPDPESLSIAIKAIPGVVEHGMFLAMASLVLIAGPSGITTLEQAG